MTDYTMVRFGGPGSGEDALSWGQQEIWAAMGRQGSSLSLARTRPLVAGESVADVAAGLRFLVERHQSLRTRLRLRDDGPPRQVAEASGEVPLEIVEAGGEDPAEVAGRLAASYQATEFDYAGEWPLRAGLVLRRGTPVHLAEVFCHLAVDGGALAVLRSDLASRPGGPSTAMPPLEQAAWQQGARGRSQSQAAIEYCERVLRALPAGRFGERLTGTPRRLRATFETPATAAAAGVLAAEFKLGTTPILLAAFEVALGQATQASPAVIQVVVSNRFRRGLGESVSPVNQAVPCVIDVAGAGFREVAARAWRASMGAYKNAYFDPRQRDDLITELTGEFGGEPSLDCYFNDVSFSSDGESGGPAPGDLRTLARRSVLTWDEPQDAPCDRAYLYVVPSPGTLHLMLTADGRYLPEAGVEAVLRGMEEVTVATVESL